MSFTHPITSVISDIMKTRLMITQAPAWLAHALVARSATSTYTKMSTGMMWTISPTSQSVRRWYSSTLPAMWKIQYAAVRPSKISASAVELTSSVRTMTPHMIVHTAKNRKNCTAPGTLCVRR